MENLLLFGRHPRGPQSACQPGDGPRLPSCQSRARCGWLTSSAEKVRGVGPSPEQLIQGYRSFRSGRLPREQDRFRELAESGQKPEIMVIGCCDSRVSPEVIFDARPGELFVVRNVANIVPPYAPDAQAHGVSAAIEFAVAALK